MIGYKIYVLELRIKDLFYQMLRYIIYGCKDDFSSGRKLVKCRILK